MQNSLAFKVIKVLVDFIIVGQLIIKCLEDWKIFYEKIESLIKRISFIAILFERNYEFLYGIIITIRKRISRTNTNDNKADDEHERQEALEDLKNN